MKTDFKWITTITLSAFVLTVLFSIGSQLILNDVHIVIGIIVILLFILIGVIFDIIGVAVQTSDHEPFHAMAAKKVKGAKSAKKMLKNAPKVSTFCNDVIGDVCNIISGSAGIVVATKIALINNLNLYIVNLIVTSLIASLTIGGKAVGKEIAIKNSEKIVTHVTKVLNMFSRR